MQLAPDLIASRGLARTSPATPAHMHSVSQAVLCVDISVQGLLQARYGFQYRAIRRNKPTNPKSDWQNASSLNSSPPVTPIDQSSCASYLMQNPGSRSAGVSSQVRRISKLIWSQSSPIRFFFPRRNALYSLFINTASHPRTPKYCTSIEI